MFLNRPGCGSLNFRCISSFRTTRGATFAWISSTYVWRRCRNDAWASEQNIVGLQMVFTCVWKLNVKSWRHFLTRFHGLGGAVRPSRWVSGPCTRRIFHTAIPCVCCWFEPFNVRISIFGGSTKPSNWNFVIFWFWREISRSCYFQFWGSGDSPVRSVPTSSVAGKFFPSKPSVFRNYIRSWRLNLEVRTRKIKNSDIFLKYKSFYGKCQSHFGDSDATLYCGHDDITVHTLCQFSCFFLLYGGNKMLVSPFWGAYLVSTPELQVWLKEKSPTPPSPAKKPAHLALPHCGIFSAQRAIFDFRFYTGRAVKLQGRVCW